MNCTLLNTLLIQLKNSVNILPTINRSLNSNPFSLHIRVWIISELQNPEFVFNTVVSVLWTAATCFFSLLVKTIFLSLFPSSLVLEGPWLYCSVCPHYQDSSVSRYLASVRKNLLLRWKVLRWWLFPDLPSLPPLHPQWKTPFPPHLSLNG